MRLLFSLDSRYLLFFHFPLDDNEGLHNTVGRLNVHEDHLPGGDVPL